jgi:uncharacterized protein (TIGR02594 family)
MAKTVQTFEDAPTWFLWALGQLGIAETPGPVSNEKIMYYRTLAHTPLEGEDGSVPWCAIFVNAALEVSQLPGTRSGMARSFERHKDFKQLLTPVLGCICTFWRGSQSSGSGHVALYRGENSAYLYCVGGNQGDAVSLAASSKARSTGYWWPRSVPVIEELRGPIAYAGPEKEGSEA